MLEAAQTDVRWITPSAGSLRVGKHPVDAMLDIALADGLTTEFFAAPANASLAHLKDIIGQVWVLVSVSDGGAHTRLLTARCFPADALITR